MEDVSYHQQRYRHMGDRIETILADRDLSFAGFAPEKPRNFAALLALVTLFQYVEGFTDKQAEEAARTRADWKYALHLPLSYSGFDPIWLCRLREVAFRSESAAASLRAFAEILGKFGLLGGVSPTVEVLNSICRLNRLVQVTEAVLLAVEALAAQGSDGLPALWLSRLYESYARTFRTLREIRTAGEAARLAGRTGEVIASLLGVVEASGDKDLKEMPEIAYLRKIRGSQYHLQEAGGLDGPVWTWRPVDCDHCNLEARGEFDTREGLDEFKKDQERRA